MSKLLLVDAMNAIHRANVYFGPKVQAHIECDLSEEECVGSKHKDYLHCLCGSPWNDIEEYCYGNKHLITYNFFRNLRPIVEQFNPDKIFLVLEGRPQFRYDIFPEYKANRIVKTAEQQSNKVKVHLAADEILKIIPYLNVSVVKAESAEADDVIASLCHQLQEEDLTIISGDTDYIQLLQKGYTNLKIYSPIKKEFMVAPTYPYLAWKCLRGDPTDNIPKILSEGKALKTITDPKLFDDFLSKEENRANFNINKQLIEFKMIPEEEIIITNGSNQFDQLKEQFSLRKFESIINDKSWKKYTDTFVGLVI